MKQYAIRERLKRASVIGISKLHIESLSDDEPGDVIVMCHVKTADWRAHVRYARLHFYVKYHVDLDTDTCKYRIDIMKRKAGL